MNLAGPVSSPHRCVTLRCSSKCRTALFFNTLGDIRRLPLVAWLICRVSTLACRGSCSMCAKSTPDSRERDSLERDWGRAIRRPRVVAPPPPFRQSDGEHWWRLALERHTGEVGAFSQTIPWEALCKHGLAAYFLEVLGDEGRDRPLVVSELARRFDMAIRSSVHRGRSDNDDLN